MAALVTAYQHAGINNPITLSAVSTEVAALVRQVSSYRVLAAASAQVAARRLSASIIRGATQSQAAASARTLAFNAGLFLGKNRPGDKENGKHNQQNEKVATSKAGNHPPKVRVLREPSTIMCG